MNFLLINQNQVSDSQIKKNQIHFNHHKLFKKYLLIQKLLFFLLDLLLIISSILSINCLTKFFINYLNYY
jgi:hypothetical protein